MKKVKFFKGIENELNALENEITEWLIESGADILSVTGNIAPQSGEGGGGGGLMGQTSFASSDVLVVILYEDRKA